MNLCQPHRQLNDLSVRIFVDIGSAMPLQQLPDGFKPQGYTTNPTLMRRAGIDDYVTTAKQLIHYAGTLPVSIAVISYELTDIYRQALEIAGWGNNVWVKIPAYNLAGESTLPVILALLAKGVMVNITCLMDEDHLREVIQALPLEARCCLSILAGRIADTGRDPCQVFRNLKMQICHHPNVQCLWASAREVFNVQQADAVGCDIITLPVELINKLHLFHRDLVHLTQQTVKQFVSDSQMAGYTLEAQTELVD